MDEITIWQLVAIIAFIVGNMIGYLFGKNDV